MKDEMIRIRLTSEEKAAIQKEADAKGITVTQLMLQSVFEKSDTVTRPIKPMELSNVIYKGLIFRFTLEADNDELEVVGRIFTSEGRPIKGIKYVFGSSVNEIVMYADKFKARVMAEHFISMLDAQGDNPYRKYMVE